MEKIVKGYFKHEAVQDSFEYFLGSEKRWNNFLMRWELQKEIISWLDSIILIVFIRLDQEQKNGSRSNYLGATLLPGDILNFQIGLENARYQHYTFIATISIKQHRKRGSNFRG